MSSPRKKALFKAVNTAPVIPTSADEVGRSAEDIFGRYVFGLATMRKRLPKDVFKKLAKTIRDGEQKWVHFFGPVNGKTKVDSFIGYAAHLGLIRGGTPSGLYC